MDVSGAKIPYGTDGVGDNNVNILERRGSYATPSNFNATTLPVPLFRRQKSRSAPGSRSGSPVLPRTTFTSKAEMEELRTALKSANYRDSTRSSGRSNRLPRSGDLRIFSPYGYVNHTARYDSDDSLYRGKQVIMTRYLLN